MPRIKIDLPATSLATVQIPVRISDINYGNHVGNDALVSIIHEARVQWLRGLGLTELNVGTAGLIMRDLAVEFKAEIFYGDVLMVEILVTDVSEVAFDLYYRLSNNAGIMVAKARTGMVCYSYVDKKAVKLPVEFSSLLNPRPDKFL